MEGHSNGVSLANDWRSQHEPNLREKVIFAIVEKLKICFPRNISDINKVAITFEDKIYCMAKDKDDYLQKISEKILAFNRKFRDVSSNLEAQALNQRHTQTLTSQQRLPPNNIQSNLNIPVSSGLPSQAPMNVSAAQNLNIQMGEGVGSNLGPGPQRQIQGRQQLLPQTPQTLQQHHHQQSLLKQPIKQQLPHHTSLSTVQQSFPQSSALSSIPSSSQQDSHQIPTQRVHSSHQQQMAVQQSQPMMLQQYQPNNPVQQQPHSRILQQHLDDTQRFDAAGSWHQSQKLVDKQKQPYQLHTAHPTNPSNSRRNSLNTSGGDWREETYQKIKALREKHVLVLSTMFQKISDKLQEIDPQQKMPYETVMKLRASKETLEKVLVFLNVSRNSISEKHRDRFSLYEEYVWKFINSQRAKKQQQKVHLPPSQIPQAALQSLGSDQMNSRLMASHQNVASSSVGGLKTSQTPMPRLLQTRPKMEPKDDKNIMSSSGNVMVHSSEQKPQQQQLQEPENEMNDVRMRQRVNSKTDLSLLTSPPQMQNNPSPQLVEQQALPTALNKTPAQEHPPPVALSPEPISERPIDRLIRAIQASSPESLAQSVSEMSSAISLSDRFAGSVYSMRGYRARLGEDLSERTRYRMQQRDTDPTKRFKRSVTATPLDITSQTDSYKIEPSCALLQEIIEINGRLVETVVNICNEDVCPSEVSSGTVVVTCSYVPVGISSTFKALYNSGHVSQIQPLRLLIPDNYPCSAITLEKGLLSDGDSVHKYEDLSGRARSRFGLSMRKYSEPMSLKEIAQVWDECARATMVEYAERHGGGTFSSKYGRWESVLRAS